MPENSPRKRNADATREDILKAAQKAFSAKGYDGAGVREIAAEVGVNAALVNRYYGSKENLFKEAILPGINFDNLLDGDKAEFGQRAAEYFCTKSHEGEALDPTLATVRSLGNPNVAKMLNDTTEEVVVKKFADWLDGENTHERAALIVSHLAGFDMMRRLVGAEALSAERADTIIPLFAKTLQFYVDGSD